MKSSPHTEHTELTEHTEHSCPRKTHTHTSRTFLEPPPAAHRRIWGAGLYHSVCACKITSGPGSGFSSVRPAQRFCSVPVGWRGDQRHMTAGSWRSARCWRARTCRNSLLSRRSFKPMQNWTWSQQSRTKVCCQGLVEQPSTVARRSATRGHKLGLTSGWLE